MNGGWFYRRHLFAEARRHLAVVLRSCRREPGLAALATYCLDISEPKTLRGLLPAYRLYTAHWSSGRPRTRPTPADHRPGPDRQSSAGRAHRPRPGPRTRSRGSGSYPESRCSTSEPSSPAW
ncbi:hypothetical protein ACWCQS_44650 [Streptomyces sp. NPDC002076]